MIVVRNVNKPEREIIFGGRKGLTRGRWSEAIEGIARVWGFWFANKQVMLKYDFFENVTSSRMRELQQRVLLESAQAATHKLQLIAASVFEYIGSRI